MVVQEVEKLTFSLPLECTKVVASFGDEWVWNWDEVAGHCRVISSQPWRKQNKETDI